MSIQGLPERGLLHVLTSWSVNGRPMSVAELEGLLGTTGASTELDDHEWDVAAARRRCHRVIFDRLVPAIADLPDNDQDWILALPAVSRTERIVSHRLVHPTDWAATVRENRGWPGIGGWNGMHFVGRHRERSHDNVLVRVLAWTASTLDRIAADASALVAGIDSGVSQEMAALRTVIALLGSDDEIPALDEVAATERAGEPWTALSRIAWDLVTLLENPLAFAYEVVLPDEALRGRLFHLAVYGEAMCVLTDNDWNVRSLRPLTGSADLPNHLAAHASGDTLEVWFEASGCWRFYGGPDTALGYGKATEAARRTPYSLSPDCLLVRKNAAGEIVRQVTLECKYSTDDVTYVARSGYFQATAYSIDLVAMSKVPTVGLVVGPDHLVEGWSSAEILTAPASTVVGLSSADALSQALATAIAPAVPASS